MARSGRRRVWSVLAGVLAVVVLVPATFAVMVWRDWRQGEQEVVEEQESLAGLIRGRLEQRRHEGRLSDADIEATVRRIRGATFTSVTERPDDLYVVAEVSVPPAFSVMVGGEEDACYGFTVPDSDAPVTVERLSPDEGPWPDECRSVAVVP